MKMDIDFELKMVAMKLRKYKLELVGVQEVKWQKVGAEQAKKNTFFYREKNEEHQLQTGFSYIRKSQQLSEWSLLVTECGT
jgi:hypothetical protein